MRPGENNGEHVSAAFANISGGSEEIHTDTKRSGPQVAPKKGTRTGHAGSWPAQAAANERTTGAGAADEGVLEAQPRATRQSPSELFAGRALGLGLGDTWSLRDADSNADADSEPTTREPKPSNDTSQAEQSDTAAPHRASALPVQTPSRRKLGARLRMKAPTARNVNT